MYADGSHGSSARTGRLRVQCRTCGSHVMVEPLLRIGGQCSTCGSYDLAPLDEARERPRHLRLVVDEADAA